MIRKFNQFIRSNGSRIAVATTAGIATVSSLRADPPTDLDGFSTVATGYITTGTTVAIAAATLGLGWVGYRIVKKFTAGAK